MMGDKVRWCDAYKHITLGGKAQHESWQPSCFIRVDEAGEIVFDDGSECWLELDELTSEGWMLLPAGDVTDSFEQYPSLAKTLTLNLLKSKLLDQKGKLHRNLYEFYEIKGSLLFGKGGYTIGYTDGHAFIDFDTVFNPLTIYSSKPKHVEEAIERFGVFIDSIVALESQLVGVKTREYTPIELKEIYKLFSNK